jgi:alpha-D-xyloside xylohydrolase
MFGPALMVAPVYEYKARTRNVYLPSACGWYDLYTGEYFRGGILVRSTAPLEKIPVYVKEGSIIPFGPEIQYTSEKPADPVILYVYTGKDASFDLYEDEDLNYNYEKGAFGIIPFRYIEQSRTLIIEERKGSFPGMLSERSFNVIEVSKDKPAGLNFAAKPDRIIKYNGQKVTLNLQ